MIEADKKLSICIDHVEIPIETIAINAPKANDEKLVASKITEKEVCSEPL